MNPAFIKFDRRLRDFIASPGLFEPVALELFALQFAHNLPYRRFCEAELRTPDTVAHWTDIPALATAAFRDFEVTSIPPEQRTAVFCSSGTTSQRPSRHFHNGTSISLYEFSLLASARAHLPLDSGSLIFLTPPALLVPHSSLVHMFDTLQRHASASHSTFVGHVDSSGAWTLNVSRVISLLTLCGNSNEPVGLLGTAFNFVHLLDALRERSLAFQLPARSWLMETGGYKGRSRSLPKPELHRALSETLGISPSRIICEYGMSELSSQAYDLSLRAIPATSDRLFRFPPWARARVLSPENGRELPDGEIGLLHVFDLANVYSVMAVATEDLAIRRGAGFELIGRADRAEPRGCSLMPA